MKKIRLFSALLAVCMMVTGSAFAWTVEDVDWSEVTVEIKNGSVSQPSDWAQSEVDAAIAAGLVPVLTGNPGYQDKITREQFAELVVRAMIVIGGEDAFNDMQEMEKTQFSDCDNVSVLIAASTGVVNGVGDGRFDPKTTTNREQIATMLLRAANVLEEDGLKLVEHVSDLTTFSDAGEVSSWAADSVGVLAHNGLLKGSDGRIMPKDPCTVEQSILLVYRLYTATRV